MKYQRHIQKRFSMKSLFVALLALAVLALESCTSVEDASPETLTIRYKSPINLSYPNTTKFEAITYGSDGITVLSRDTVGRVVEGPYRANGDNSIWFYHWKDESHGVLISYRQGNHELASGVIVHGTYSAKDTTLFDSPRLWLPFPADTGVSGAKISEDNSSIQTLANLNFTLYGSNRIYQTIGYRSASDTTSTFSYYEINRGLSAQLSYKKGIRTQSLLKL